MVENHRGFIIVAFFSLTKYPVFKKDMEGNHEEVHL